MRVHRLSIPDGLILTFALILSVSCNNDKSIQPVWSAPVTDIDGNVYQTVLIGTQTWMAENLKVTHYRNGDTILNVAERIEWKDLNYGAFCFYGNDSIYDEIYGLLYNWFAVDDNRNIAPEGWHVPSDTEWQILIDYLGGDAVAGGKMKDSGTRHWISPNEKATNEYGFTALPGGYRTENADYFDVFYCCHFWSSTDSSGALAWNRYLNTFCGIVYRLQLDKKRGFSIRCVKD